MTICKAKFCAAMFALVTMFMGAQVGAQIIPDTTQTTKDEQRQLRDGVVYYAKIKCSGQTRGLAQISRDVRLWSGKKNLNVVTYVQLIGLSGLVPEGKPPSDGAKVELKDNAGQPLTKVEVSGITFQPFIAPVMVRTKGKDSLSLTYDNRVPCQKSAFYFRYSKSQPAMALWTEIASNENRAELLRTILVPAAGVIDGVLKAVFDKAVPGFQTPGNITDFSKAVNDVFAAFDKKSTRSEAVVFGLGDTKIDMSGLDVTVTIWDADKARDGGVLPNPDFSFLTGVVPFSTTWGDFLNGTSAGYLREKAAANEIDHCKTASAGLRLSGGDAVRLSKTDAAFVMLAALQGGGVSTNNAFACLDVELACASRDFTALALSQSPKRLGEVVKSKIDAAHYFDNTIPDIGNICAEFDAQRESDKLVKWRKLEDEKKRAEVARLKAEQEGKRIEAEQAAMFALAEAHSAEAWQFFVADDSGQTRLNKFSKFAAIVAIAPESRIALYRSTMNRLGAEKVRGLIPLDFIESIFVRTDALTKTLKDASSTDQNKQVAQTDLELIDSYFGGGIWEIDSPSSSTLPLIGLTRALSVSELKDFRCYYAYQTADIADEIVKDSLVFKLFGDHSDFANLPHFLLLAFSKKPTSAADLAEGHVVHGFVQGNKIVKLAVDWKDNITAQQVVASLQQAGKSNSCVVLQDLADSGT